MQSPLNVLCHIDGSIFKNKPSNIFYDLFRSKYYSSLPVHESAIGAINDLVEKKDCNILFATDRHPKYYRLTLKRLQHIFRHEPFDISLTQLHQQKFPTKVDASILHNTQIIIEGDVSDARKYLNYNKQVLVLKSPDTHSVLLNDEPDIHILDGWPDIHLFIKKHRHNMPLIAKPY